MHLSIHKIHGAKQVRARRLLRVLCPHEVSAKGAALDPTAGARSLPGTAPIATVHPQAGKDDVVAVVGDLAIEVVDVHGAFVGYSYLTGAPVTCMAYHQDMGERFETARFRRLHELEALVDEGNRFRKDAPDAEAIERRILTQLVDTLHEVRESDTDVGYFEISGRNAHGHDMSRDIAVMLCDMWTAERQGRPARTPDERTCNLAGTVWGKRPRVAFGKVGRSSQVHLHLQPKRHANDHAMSAFQASLLSTLPSPS